MGIRDSGCDGGAGRSQGGGGGGGGDPRRIGEFQRGCAGFGDGLGGGASGADGFGAPDFGRDFSSHGNFCASGGFVNFVGGGACVVVYLSVSAGGEKP